MAAADLPGDALHPLTPTPTAPDPHPRNRGLIGVWDMGVGLDPREDGQAHENSWVRESMPSKSIQIKEYVGFTCSARFPPVRPSCGIARV
ncbi:hypothetical protein NOCA2140015 [metagenome]|uniref:Uncharacterized protein n=1 Tax=metagenome TaxID=256318 RepID=A0A2P2C0G6_9ZZZZ